MGLSRESEAQGWSTEFRNPDFDTNTSSTGPDHRQVIDSEPHGPSGTENMLGGSGDVMIGGDDLAPGRAQSVDPDKTAGAMPPGTYNIAPQDMNPISWHGDVEEVGGEINPGGGFNVKPGGEPLTAQRQSIQRRQEDLRSESGKLITRIKDPAHPLSGYKVEYDYDNMVWREQDGVTWPEPSFRILDTPKMPSRPKRDPNFTQYPTERHMGWPTPDFEFNPSEGPTYDPFDREFVRGASKTATPLQRSLDLALGALEGLGNRIGGVRGQGVVEVAAMLRRAADDGLDHAAYRFAQETMDAANLSQGHGDRTQSDAAGATIMSRAIDARWLDPYRNGGKKAMRSTAASPFIEATREDFDRISEIARAYKESDARRDTHASFRAFGDKMTYRYRSGGITTNIEVTYYEGHGIWAKKNGRETKQMKTVEGWFDLGKESIRRVAHDSGDGATIFHCPFCGSGNVTGRSDQSAECGYCSAVFTVQAQPQHSFMPQTVNGQPFDIPGMPESDEFAPSDDVGVEELYADEPGGDAAGDDDEFPFGEEEDETEAEDLSDEPEEAAFLRQSSLFITSEGVALSLDDYTRHLAARHLRG